VPRIVDLSFDIYDRAPTFWPDPKTAVIEHMKVENLGYNITQLVMSTHMGTHLDAPYHFLDEGRTVDQIDLARCFGPAWVLDFSGKGPGGQITLADLKVHADRITPGSRLILRTGWDKVFPDPRYFKDCPMVLPEACEYLAERRIGALALDMPTVCGEQYVETHHALLKAEVLIVEGLAHLDELKDERVLFIALPLSIRGRDGSPCRAVAIEGLTDEQLQALDMPILPPK